jgi:hypothetical protein
VNVVADIADFNTALASNTRTPKDFAALINGAWRKGANAFFEAGQYVTDAKAELDRDQYKSLIKQLPFSESTAKKLSRISGNSVLSSHVNSLPPHLTILYILSQIDAEILEAAIADGRIHPGMKQKDALALKPKDAESEEHEEGKTSTPPAPKSAFAVAWDTAFATEDGRTAIATKLDQVGRNGLCAVLPEKLRAELHDYILSQQVMLEKLEAEAPDSILIQKIKTASKTSTFAVNTGDQRFNALTPPTFPPSYAEPVNALLAFFKTMTGPTALIKHIESGPWRDADEDVRFEIIALIDAAIIKHRERLGFLPMDDALPAQPDNVFLILREHLFPPDGGAIRGEARPYAA